MNTWKGLQAQLRGHALQVLHACVQVQANVTGDLADMDVASMFDRIGAGVGGEGKPPMARDDRQLDLAVWLAYQLSSVGREHQQRLTVLSKEVAECVGGHSIGSGDKIATVHHRLMRQVAPRPGVWLLRAPLSEEKLVGKPSTFHDPADV